MAPTISPAPPTIIIAPLFGPLDSEKVRAETVLALDRAPLSMFVHPWTRVGDKGTSESGVARVTTGAGVGAMATLLKADVSRETLWAASGEAKINTAMAVAKLR
jgi:hypothetical protein